MRKANDIVCYSQILIFGKSNHPFYQADKSFECWLLTWEFSSARSNSRLHEVEWSGLGPIYPLTSEQESVTKVAQAGHWCWSPG